MGYYSEVAFCMPSATHTVLLEALAKENQQIQDEVNDLINSAEKSEKNDAHLYYWSWIKWYSSFPCVGFITKFLQQIDEDEELEYRLLVVGESMDDNSDEGDFYDTPFEVEIVRSISYAQ